MRLLLIGLLAATTAFAQDEAPFVVEDATAEQIEAAAPGAPHSAATPASTPEAATPAIAPHEPAPEVAAEGADVPSDMPVARALPVNEREIVTQLQIFLDQKNFGPGKIDGRWGEFTGKALKRYQTVHGLPVNEGIDPELAQSVIHPIYTTYTIREEDAKKVGTVPSQPSEQAKKKYMPYSSLLEFVEERYHSDPDFLQKLNPELNLANLKVGDTLRVPNVEPFKLEDVKETGRLPEIPEFMNRTIRVDTTEKMLDLIEDTKIIASFPITPGSGRLPAPKGTWKILGIATMPWFRYDKSVLEHGVRSNNFHNIPAGPNNPVGVVWMGLNKPGIGIHGTNNPQTIGRSGSHGCIRVANWDVIRLTQMVTKGMTVIIE